MSLASSPYAFCIGQGTTLPHLSIHASHSFFRLFHESNASQPNSNVCLCVSVRVSVSMSVPVCMCVFVYMHVKEVQKISHAERGAFH